VITKEELAREIARMDSQASDARKLAEHFRELAKEHEKAAIAHGRRATAWFAIGIVCAIGCGWFARAFFTLPPFAIEADGLKLACVEPGSIIMGNVVLFLAGITFGSFPLYRIIDKNRAELAKQRAELATLRPLAFLLKPEDRP
jgi:hypothetical protein